MNIYTKVNRATNSNDHQQTYEDMIKKNCVKQTIFDYNQHLLAFCLYAIAFPLFAFRIATVHSAIKDAEMGLVEHMHIDAYGLAS